MEVSELYEVLKDRYDAFVCIAGVPKSGKSTYIMEIVEKLAKNDEKKIMFFSPAKEAVFIERWFEGVFEGSCQSKIIINDTPAIDVESIIELSKKEKPDVIVIDYFELITDKVCCEKTRVDELNSIANKLNTLSKEFEIPILLEVQMSTYYKKGHDKLSIKDLRCAGEIGEISDLIIFTNKD
ncbi:MAG: DnaB-like helicase C-terminal domain-containing protein [Agathobacter sp.]|nr:DnaB-like helicase C-terminal domain-containing protein [Agathobacter sp.]